MTLVAPNTPITYYLDIMYDGTDKFATTSSNTVYSQVYSDYIYIEDKLPNGLIFKGFVKPNGYDDTDMNTHRIGAVQYGDTTKACVGYVIDGYEGLNYDADTGIVSFKIKNLMAGCKITIGIETETPTLPSGVKRMDFYNTANGFENLDSTISNTVHFYMGADTETLYNVTYRFTGTVPDGAADLLPNGGAYAQGTTIGVENDVLIDGYTFSGWTTTGVSVGSDGKFTMPNKDIEFVGSFTKKTVPEYTVHYSIEGTTPEGFIPPKDKAYAAGKEVIVDGLKEGDIVNGYKFLGWTITTGGIDIMEDALNVSFEMPAKNVSIVGRFEILKYTVSYEFIGSNIPPNANSLLPSSKTYVPGEEVTIASNPVASGYKFVGWYSPDKFTMPDEDIVIQGEWMIDVGSFRPSISKRITNTKEYYHEGDEVLFEITVTNNASFAIKEVQVIEQLDNAVFVAGTGYTLKDEKFVVISSIAAEASVKVQAKYIVGNDVYKTYTNTVELGGAIADNNFNLDPDGNYEASISFKVTNLKLEVNKINEENEVLSGAKFGLYSDSSAANLVSTGMIFENLEPNRTYYLKEIVAPTGYKLESQILEVSVDDTGEITIGDLEVTMVGGVGKVNIVNRKIDILPQTGKPGIMAYTIIGLVAVGGSIAGYSYYTYRKVKENEKV